MPTPTAADRSVRVHRARWGEPEIVSRAPGRVNLIGEHTDYNDGFTLPTALPFDTVVALHSTGDRDCGLVTVEATGFGTVLLDPATDPGSVEPWARHLAGVVRLLGEAGVESGGWRAVIETDIPTGASLSSSAALEVAVIQALLARAGVEWDPLAIARLGQRVENEVVGLASGIMDQYISAGATARSVSLMDCRALTLEPIAWPDDLVVAVLDTGTRRVLAEVAYDERRASCEAAADTLGVSSLRDATTTMVDTLSDPMLRRRARHVVTENERTTQAAQAIRLGHGPKLGQLMDASHESLRHDYEVSGPGLDAMVEVARAAPGCLGARMTGGGFAGCAVALVARADVEPFVDAVLESYDHAGHAGRVWLAEPSPGASLLDVR